MSTECSGDYASSSAQRDESLDVRTCTTQALSERTERFYCALWKLVITFQKENKNEKYFPWNSRTPAKFALQC